MVAVVEEAGVEAAETMIGDRHDTHDHHRQDAEIHQTETAIAGHPKGET